MGTGDYAITGMVSAEEIPDYENILSDLDRINDYIESIDGLKEIFASLEVEKLNIEAYDVEFCAKITSEGLISNIDMTLDNDYDTIIINDNLIDLVEDIESAEEYNDYWNLVAYMDIPASYYLKLPEIIMILI